MSLKTKKSKSENPSPILFYDGDCGLCNMAVRFVLFRDRKHKFYFASLKSITAHKLLSDWQRSHASVDSIILYENEDDGKGIVEVISYARAIFRICWLLGGLWKIPGLLSFLPDWFLVPYNFLYKLFAKNRKRLSCFYPFECKLGVLQPSDRFLA